MEPAPSVYQPFFSDGLCLYGGSFDPLHEGHVAILNWCDKHCQATLVIPTYAPYYKSPQATFDQRLTALQQALNLHGWERIEVSSIEQQWPETAGATGQLLRSLQARFPMERLRLVVGLDSWFDIHGWKNVTDWFGDVDWIVFPREAEPPPEYILKGHLAVPQWCEDAELATHSSFATELICPTNRIYLVETPKIDISSSTLRANKQPTSENPIPQPAP